MTLPTTKIDDPAFKAEYLEDYQGWKIFRVTHNPMHPEIVRVEYVGYLIEEQYYKTTWEKQLHYSDIGQAMHNAAHVLHADTLENLKIQIETFGQASRQAYETQKFLSENWFMLLLGAGYVSLLGLSMYQSYNWSD